MSKSESRSRGWMARGAGVIAATGLVAFAAPVATPVVGTALVASADAATYELEQCTTQNPGVSGWESAYAGAWVYVGNDCPSGGGLATAFDTNQGHTAGNTAQWTFTAPSNTNLHSMSVASRQMRAGRPHPGGFGDSSAFVIKNGTTVLEDCVQLYGCGTRNGAAYYSFDGASSTTFGVQCTGGNGCPADVVNASLRGITMRLNDNLAPSLSGVSGSLTSTNTLARTRQLAFSATDQGGGVFRRRLIIDDVPQAVGTVDTNGGQCATPFRERVPCKLSASETFSFDTATLSDGTHDISLRVTDATDVNQAQSSEWTIKVDNQPPAFDSVSVSGSAAQVGTELTCTPSAINGQTPTVTYQWYRANADGSGQQAITGATTNKYTPTSQDSNKKLRCEVVATDGGGSTTRISPTTSGPFDNGATVQPAPVQPQPTPTPTPEPPAACPQNPTGVGTGPTEDFDGDRIPNCRDEDDDEDGTPDNTDPEPFNNKVPKPPEEKPVSNPGTGGSGAPVGGAGSSTAEKVNGENGSPSAVLAASWLKGKTRGQTTRYGTSATIRGQLTRPDGVKVDDAKIELVYLEAGVVRDMGGARTRKDGSFVLKLPSNSPSRKLQLRYRYDLSKQDVTSKVDLTLTVRATARLSVVKRPGALRLSGKIGAPGKLGSRKVTIQYRTAGRSWRPFLTLRTTSAGKFSGRYRLAAPLRGKVQFRAVVGSAGSHIGGASPTKKVRF